MNEYYKTFFGSKIDEFEGISSYRFDISLEILSHINYMLRLFTTEEQLWIFGMHILYRNSPEPINESYNITLHESDNQKIKNISSFIEKSFYRLSNRVHENENINLEKSTVKSQNLQKQHGLDEQVDNRKSKESEISVDLEQLYLRIENLIETKFNEIEKRHDEKLEKIISLIEKKF